MAKDKSEALQGLAKSLEDLSGIGELAEEIKDLKDVIVDSNEELIATFVEGTKRIIKKEDKDVSPQLKNLSESITGGLEAVKKGIAEVERGVKSIKLPSGTDFRATGAMLKLPIKELTRAVEGLDLNMSTDAKKPIAVRLSDGENFYKALDQVIQTISGGGSTSYAFETSSKSPGKGLIDTDGHVQVDVLTMPGVTIDTTGLATEAKQNTIITHIDGVEGLLTTIDADTGNIATSVASIDTKTPALGQALASASVPVVLTAAQLTTLTPLSTVSVTQSGTWDEVGINDSGNSITMDVNGTAVSSTNPLLIGAMAIQDTGNSTTATLGSGGNFTGTAFDLNSYSSWSINIFSDKASSSNGLVVQWSDDGTNWDFSDAITYVASVGNMITFGRKARYVRLNYTNTNSAQTVFRVTAYAQPLSARQTRKFVGSALSDGETGQVVIAGIQGHTTAGGGAWVDVKVSPSGSLSANVSGSTLGANSGVDIGDVTINNASGASAVNIQDGGNTITVDGTVTANLAAGTNNIGDVDILSIAAGDNNIGNVDVVTLPSLPAGTNAIGKLAANSGVDIGDVDITSIAAGTNNIGQVSVAPQTANGLSVFNATSSDGATALTSTAQAIKASAGQLYGWYIYNPNSSAAYVQLYNTAAASVTVGTTNPLFMLTIPATSAANVEFTNGITFSNAGWSCSATSTAGGNGAPTTALDAVFFYK